MHRTPSRSCSWFWRTRILKCCNQNTRMNMFLDLCFVFEVCSVHWTQNRQPTCVSTTLNADGLGCFDESCFSEKDGKGSHMFSWCILWWIQDGRMCMLRCASPFGVRAVDRWHQKPWRKYRAPGDPWHWEVIAMETSTSCAKINHLPGRSWGGWCTSAKGAKSVNRSPLPMKMIENGPENIPGNGCNQAPE